MKIERKVILKERKKIFNDKFNVENVKCSVRLTHTKIFFEVRLLINLT